MPSLEGPEKNEGELSPDEKFTRGAFQRFLARPGIPKLSYEEQNELKKIGVPQTEEEAKKFAESKKDKFHVSAVSSVLGAAVMYLDSDSNKFSPELNKAMRAKLEYLNEEMEISKEQEHMNQAFMAEVIEFVEEFESHL